MPNKNNISLREALNWGTIFLKNKKISEAHLDSQLILSFVLNKGKEELYKDFNNSLSFIDWQIYKELLKNRAKGVPCAYILGKKEFMSLEFLINNYVFIPRPETEILVEKTISLTNKKKQNIKILDIGTGSGVIAICLAKFIPNGQVYATDISAEALKTAELNAKKHKVEKKIIFLKGSLFTPLNKIKFDIIVANPPYISEIQMKKIAKEIKYEPKIALYGGKDGLEFFQKLVSQIKNYLKKEGIFICEIGDGQKEKILNIINKERIFREINFIPDYAGIERIFIGYA